MFLRVFSIFTLICFIATHVQGSEENPRVGIIGAGVGGTSAAHFLRELFGESVEIDIFEKQHVGGRLAPITISEHNYNAGGTIIHPENMYMLNFTELLGLQRDLKPESGRLGIFDGEKVLFTTSDYTAVTIAKLFWRYGMDVYNIKSWVREKVLKHMHRLYDLQRDGHAFSSVEDLLNAMDPSLVEFSKKSTRTLLKEEGFSDLFIDELVNAAIRVTYGQTTEAHGCLGATAMVAFDAGLWSVAGGNHQVPKGLLQKAGANLIQGEVTTVTLVNEGSPPVYQIDYLPGKSKDEDDLKTKEYDIVIVAAPFYKGMSNIKFEDFQSDISPVDNDFHLTVTSFLEGRPNTSYFGIDSIADFPNILTNKKDTYFTAIVKQKAVSGEEPAKPVYRIYFNQGPSADQLNQLIPERTDMSVVNWMAYPEYPSSANLPSFTLHDQMYHLNAIEMAASCMEMSAISAKNIALLAYYRYTGQYDKIDEIMPESNDHEKSEL